MPTQPFLKLVESGSSSNDTMVPPREKLKRQLIFALDITDSEYGGSLPMKGPWQLDPACARQLHAKRQQTLPAHWSGLIGLASNGTFFKTNGDNFIPQISSEEVAQAPADRLQKKLLETFTAQLIPPSTAAGFFLLLGIHPVWGLRVARRVQRQTREDAPPVKRQSGSREAKLEMVRDAVFEALGGIMAMLRNLENGQRYPLEHFTDCMRRCCASARQQIQISDEGSTSDLPILFSSGKSKAAESRAITFATSDFFKSFLVPANVVRLCPDSTFCIRPDRLSNIRVDDRDVESQNRALADLMHDQRHSVA
jgi:hypothetical protein